MRTKDTVPDRVPSPKRSVIEQLRGLLISPQGISSRPFWISFAVIAVVATVLRFWNLAGASLWMDEAVTAAFARLPLDVIAFNQIDNHPPLPYIVQHFWMAITSDPGLLRVPVAIVGTLAVIASMMMGSDRVSRSTGLVFGLLFALSTGQIYYSQDLRMYPYIMLGLTLAAWGGIGMASADRRKPFMYAALYVFGGAVAIYSHVIGLIAMGVIGIASLIALGFLTDRLERARGWLIANVVLLILVAPWLIILPAAMESFPGMPSRVPVTDFHWHLRNAVGYPGLSGLGLLQLALEVALYGFVLLGAIAAWLHGRRATALTIVGLAIVYPLLIAGLQFSTSIIHVRIFLPAGIGVILGAAYAVTSLKSLWLRAGGLITLAGLSLGSSIYELRHHVKLEDYRAAYVYADSKGYADAPIIMCIDFAAAAAWEERPDAHIYLMLDDELIIYPGLKYWDLVEDSIMTYRKTSAHQRDARLGGGLIVEGGLVEALKNEDRAYFLRPGCHENREARIWSQMQAAGFEVEEETLITGVASEHVLLEAPGTKVTLFRRAAGDN